MKARPDTFLQPVLPLPLTRQVGVWARRRARRLESFYSMPRREAIGAALEDLRSFMPALAKPRLRLIKGGKS